MPPTTKRNRKGITHKHQEALVTTYRLQNITPDAMAIAENNFTKSRRDNWRRYLRDLEIDGMLASKRLCFSHPGGLSMPLGSFFCLTRYGAEVIADMAEIDPEEVIYPINGIQASSPFQFPHRHGLIKILASFIAAENADEEGFEVLDIWPEYQHNGLKKATRVTIPGDKTIVIPDAILRYRAGDRVHLATVEFHRETDAKRIIQQLQNHKTAIEHNLFSSLFGHPYSNHVLSVHEDKDKLRGIIERLRAGEIPGFKDFAPGFHFATIDDVIENGVRNSFYRVDGTKSDIF